MSAVTLRKSASRQGYLSLHRSEKVDGLIDVLSLQSSDFPCYIIK